MPPVREDLSQNNGNHLSQVEFQVSSETWAELIFQEKYCISLEYSEVFLFYFLDICGDEWWAEGE